MNKEKMIRAGFEVGVSDELLEEGWQRMISFYGSAEAADAMLDRSIEDQKTSSVKEVLKKIKVKEPEPIEHYKSEQEKPDEPK